MSKLQPEKGRFRVATKMRGNVRTVVPGHFPEDTAAPIHWRFTADKPALAPYFDYGSVTASSWLASKVWANSSGFGMLKELPS